MVDGDVFARFGHSVGCVTLSDDTIAISVFGGYFSSNSVISSSCFYQWSERLLIDIYHVYNKLILCLYPHHSSVLQNGLPAAGTGVLAVSHESASASLVGETSLEVTVTC